MGSENEHSPVKQVSAKTIQALFHKSVGSKHQGKTFKVYSPTNVASKCSRAYKSRRHEEENPTFQRLCQKHR
jgi:hypothetical protein